MFDLFFFFFFFLCVNSYCSIHIVLLVSQSLRKYFIVTVGVLSVFLCESQKVFYCSSIHLSSDCVYCVLLTVPLLESKRVVSQVFPLHSEEDLTMLKRSWVQAIFKTQPLGLYLDTYFKCINTPFSISGQVRSGQNV